MSSHSRDLWRCLAKAAEIFPEGCTCDDSLDCGFCRSVVAMAQRVAKKKTCDLHQTPTELLSHEYSEVVIPASEDAQVYELGRMFRL